MTTTQKPIIVIGHIEHGQHAVALAQLLDKSSPMDTPIRESNLTEIPGRDVPTFQLNRREVRRGSGWRKLAEQVRLVRHALRTVMGAEAADKLTSDTMRAEAARQAEDKILLEDATSKLKSAEFRAGEQVRGQKLDLDRAIKELREEWHVLQRTGKEKHNDAVLRAAMAGKPAPQPPEGVKMNCPIPSDWHGFDWVWTDAKRAQVKERAKYNLIREVPEVKALLQRIAAVRERMVTRPTYTNLVAMIRANPTTDPMTKVGIHDLVNGLYFISGESDAYDLKNYGRVPAHALMMRALFDGRQIDDPREVDIQWDGTYSVHDEEPVIAHDERRLLLDKIVMADKTEFFIVHEDWEGYTLAEFMEKYAVRVTASHGSTKGAEKWQQDRPSWVATIEYDDREMFVDFYSNSLPKGEEVLNCLASDIASVENARSFEDWAEDMGYGADSRKGERIYKAIEGQRDELLTLLGKDVLDTLVWRTQSL